MDKKELQMLGFEIVAYSGDARSVLLNLLKEVRSGQFDNVDEALQEADRNLALAHKAQTALLVQEAAGEDLQLGFIFVHGQDHLMTTLLLRDLITDFVELYKSH